MTEHITIQKPQIHTGPADMSVDEATAYYLQGAAQRVRDQRYWGSGVTALVSKVLDDAAAALGRAEASTTAELLTAEEHAVMDQTAELANALHGLVGDGTSAAHDWNEIAASIHVIQHAVLTQAAARAYPGRYRLLGRTLVEA